MSGRHVLPLFALLLFTGPWSPGCELPDDEDPAGDDDTSGDDDGGGPPPGDDDATGDDDDATGDDDAGDDDVTGDDDSADDDTAGDDDTTGPPPTECEQALGTMYGSCGFDLPDMTEVDAVATCETEANPTYWQCARDCLVADFTDCASAEACVDGCASCESAHAVQYNDCSFPYVDATEQEANQICEDSGGGYWDCAVGCYTYGHTDCQTGGSCLEQCYNDWTYHCDCLCWCQNINECMIPGSVEVWGLGDAPTCHDLCSEANACGNCGGLAYTTGTC